MTLTPEQLNAMSPTGQTAPAQPANGNPPWLQAMLDSGMDSTQSAATLGHATGMLQKTFQSPMQNIASGNAGENVDVATGALKQGARDLSMAGMQNAGPVGAQIMADAKAKGGGAAQFAQGIEGFNQATQPTNAAQQSGAMLTSIGEAAIPFGSAKVTGAVSRAVDKAGGMLGKLADSTGVTKFLADRAEKKALQSTLDAVYTSPTGKKFTQTAGQIIGGKREITPSSIFREQGITPDQQTVNLATRLKGIGLGKDPVKNTQILSKEMTNTESKLQTALKGDPNVQYSADKPKLFQSLEAVKNNAPEEFRIKDSQTMVNKVVDFANKLATKAEDNIGGLRDGRIAFDTQAKREFPTAFKPDGTIDTKTPAGYAIKTVRDSWNEHLYNTAPNGSEIQSLIGHEADLYRANQAAVEKAASGQGKKKIAQWIENNPKTAGAIGAAGGLEINKKLKEWTGLGF